MALLIKGGGGAVVTRPALFANESELEQVVASEPNLITGANEQGLALVASQVDLPEAGILDLLFVTEDGLPIAAEVKLAKNAESRRQIVAQLVDYLSALTALTVDELDAQVNGALERALRSFDSLGPDNGFERRWQAVGANLRAGLARMVLVLDSVPADLERIARFLSDHTNLDIRVVEIGKHDAGAVGMVYSPNLVIASDGDVASRPADGPREIRPELAGVVAAYDRTAPQELRTQGTAPSYRTIRPPEWQAGFRVHYEFIQSRAIGVELHLENSQAALMGPELMEMAGTKIGPGLVPLEWDQKWSHGCGRLQARFKLTDGPEMIAAAMNDLIARTRQRVALAETGILGGKADAPNGRRL